MITYRILKRDYILREGDELLLHGVHYKVAHNASHWYYLENKDRGSNFQVFYNLGIGRELADKWAKCYGSDGTGIFPNIPTLEQLSNFVISIYEHHKYKIGDKVVIKERMDDAGAYPYYFGDNMADLAGNIYEVKDAYICSLDELDESDTHLHFDGDIYQYKLTGGDGKADDYMWHSSMLCPYQSIHIEESDIIGDEPDSQEHINYEQIQAKKVTMDYIQFEDKKVDKSDSIIVTLPTEKINTTIKL